MNEIIRIHIVGTPYNIEVAAHKELNLYLKSLKLYLKDDEVYEDIQHRIVELLHDKNVKSDGTITTKHVSELKEILGAPEEFSSQEAPVNLSDGEAEHRLYRDPSTGILGGVASGIALYFGVNVVIIRLLLLFFTIISFGTALLLYIVLWLVLPPVRNAADRLVLEGRPVTIPAMQEISTKFGQFKNRDRTILRAVTYITGTGFAAAALGALGVTVAAVVSLLYQEELAEYAAGVIELETVYSIFGLFVVSGVLLAALFTVMAYVSFSLRINRVIAGITVAIIALGLTSFISGAIWINGVEKQMQRHIDAHTHTINIPVTGDLSSITKAEFITGNVDLEYIVTEENPRVEMTAYMEDRREAVLPQITVTNDVAVVSADYSETDCNMFTCSRRAIVIYGPALESIEVTSGSLDYQVGQQDSLRAKVAEGQSLYLTGGQINELSLDVAPEGHVSATQTSVRSANVSLKSGAQTSLASLATLNLTSSQNCAVNSIAKLDVVSADRLVINDKEVDPVPTEETCYQVQFMHATMD